MIDLDPPQPIFDNLGVTRAWMHLNRIYNKKGRQVGLIFQDMVVDIKGNQLGLLKKNLFRDMNGYVVAWLKGGLGGPRLPLMKLPPAAPKLAPPIKSPSMPKPLPPAVNVASWSSLSWDDFISGPPAPPAPEKKPS